MTTILVIDDEENICRAVQAYLEAEGFAVETAHDGRDGLHKFRRHQPELVVLDIMLPEMDGLEVLRHIRQESEAYVLLLTARAEEVDRVIGLSVGGDDYLTKPFSGRELVARVKAILRRSRDPRQTHIMRFQRLVIDEKRHEIMLDGVLLDLTPIEFKILVTLAAHAGFVLSRDQLIEHVWGTDFYGETRVVDVHIGNLRQKIEDDPTDPALIVTVRGVGYKFMDERQ